jgi:hypothetical protein
VRAQPVQLQWDPVLLVAAAVGQLRAVRRVVRGLRARWVARAQAHPRSPAPEARVWLGAALQAQPVQAPAVPRAQQE